MTTPHVYDDLPLLLRGEADHATVRGTAAHLRECEDCRHELISALAAHASLSAAGRVLRLAPADATDSAAGEDLPLPDMTALFARVRREALQARPASSVGSAPNAAALVGPSPNGIVPNGTAPNVQAPGVPAPNGTAPVADLAARRAAAANQGTQRRRGPNRWLAAAAAVIIGAVVGVGATVGAQKLHNGAPASRTVRLDAYDKGTVPASAMVVGGDEVRLDAATLPAPGKGKVYEVWLTNSARTQMYALGSFGSDQTGTFTLPAGLMPAYSAIEVSVQPISTSAYSGVSVLRGSYG